MVGEFGYIAAGRSPPAPADNVVQDRRLFKAQRQTLAVEHPRQQRRATECRVEDEMNGRRWRGHCNRIAPAELETRQAGLQMLLGDECRAGMFRARHLHELDRVLALDITVREPFGIADDGFELLQCASVPRH